MIKFLSENLLLLMALALLIFFGNVLPATAGVREYVKVDILYTCMLNQVYAIVEIEGKHSFKGHKEFQIVTIYEDATFTRPVEPMKCEVIGKNNANI